MKKQSRDPMTEYAVGKYLLGYEKIALIVASVVFENTIRNKYTEIFEREPYETYSLCKQLKELEKEETEKEKFIGSHNKFTIDQIIGTKNIDKLWTFKNIRNKIVHKLPEFDNSVQLVRSVNKSYSQDEIDDFILYIWAENSPETLERELGRNRGPKDQSLRGYWESKHGEASGKRADYLIRSFDESFEEDTQNKSQELQENAVLDDVLQDIGLLYRDDFRDLFVIKNRFSRLHVFLKEWLNIEYPEMIIIPPSRVDTTSAYVWMPVMDKEEYGGNGRSKIEKATVTIQATPITFSVYFNPGGYAYEDRKKYCEFLGSENLKNVLDQAVPLEKYFMMFDVRWYVFVENKLNYKDVLTEEWKESAGQEIADERERILAHSKEHTPITTNKYLFGYIMETINSGNSNTDKTADIIDFESIKLMLGKMIDIYKSIP